RGGILAPRPRRRHRRRGARLSPGPRRRRPAPARALAGRRRGCAEGAGAISRPVLEGQGLVKAFGGVRGVGGGSLRAEAGRLLAMIGPNGAGKSTCFNMLNGQLRPDAGRVLLDGRDVTGLPTRAIWALGVGRTFQITATFASMTVRENVQLALLSHHGQA